MVAGVVAGTVIAWLAAKLIGLRSMAPVQERYARLLGPLMRNRVDRLFISCCAGVGEEVFFRGALQHWLGIPVTAIVFVAMHGYLDPRDRRILVYGVFMTVAMMGIGWMASLIGLLAPMIAHTLIDIILLDRLYVAYRELPPAE